ncbi:MAG: TlpA family protein disulfide reductase [Bacteroidales bacterium]|nr:TlpA family protein disulfide reductase [Bacteroidales bacterium]
MKKILLTLVAALFMGTGLMAQNATMPQNITLRTIDGQSVPSSVIQNDGRPVIVSFWATWCKPCNRELNNIKEVYEEWQEETGVKIVAVSIDDARSANRVKPHAEGNDWPYEIYLDQNSDLKRAMGVVNVPHTFILNGKGEIVWQHTGYQDGGEEELIEHVRELLK